MSKSTVSFTSTIDRFNSNLWHFHVVVPTQIASGFINGNDRRIICTINKTETFQAALMPLGDGNFFINVNKTLRSKLKVNDGDEVLITIQKDTSEYGLPVPEEFKELLKLDISGSDLFHSLTAGKQRTLLYIIAKPKSTDLRIRNGIAVLKHLNLTKGKIDYKQLNQEIKNTF